MMESFDESVDNAGLRLVARKIPLDDASGD